MYGFTRFLLKWVYLRRNKYEKDVHKYQEVISNFYFFNNFYSFKILFLKWMCFILPYSESEVKSLSRVWLFATPWTYQAPPSMEFSRQKYWSGLPFPSPGDLPHPGIEPGSPTLQADTVLSEPQGSPNVIIIMKQKLKWEFMRESSPSLCREKLVGCF